MYKYPKPGSGDESELLQSPRIEKQITKIQFTFTHALDITSTKSDIYKYFSGPGVLQDHYLSSFKLLVIINYKSIQFYIESKHIDILKFRIEGSLFSELKDFENEITQGIIKNSIVNKFKTLKYQQKDVIFIDQTSYLSSCLTIVLPAIGRLLFNYLGFCKGFDVSPAIFNQHSYSAIFLTLCSFPHWLCSRNRGKFSVPLPLKTLFFALDRFCFFFQSFFALEVCFKKFKSNPNMKMIATICIFMNFLALFVQCIKLPPKYLPLCDRLAQRVTSKFLGELKPQIIKPENHAFTKLFKFDRIEKFFLLAGFIDTALFQGLILSQFKTGIETKLKLSNPYENVIVGVPLFLTVIPYWNFNYKEPVQKNKRMTLNNLGCKHQFFIFLIVLIPSCLTALISFLTIVASLDNKEKNPLIQFLTVLSPILGLVFQIRPAMYYMAIKSVEKRKPYSEAQALTVPPTRRMGYDLLDGLSNRPGEGNSFSPPMQAASSAPPSVPFIP